MAKMKFSGGRGAGKQKLLASQPDSAITIKFGNVTIESESAPAHDVVLSNVKRGNAAFRRATSKIVTPGVDLRTAENVAIYFVDPEDPTFLVRKLHGQVARGRLKAGKFLRMG